MAVRRTGYVFEERYMWHDPGPLHAQWVEPSEHWENAATKRRIHNLLSLSGLFPHKLVHIPARVATKAEILTVHSERYHDRIASLNDTGGDAGEVATFAKGGYEIACLSAGGVLAAMESLLAGDIDNAYCLVRPPGHHATRELGMGFCIFNNIAIAAHYARSLRGQSTEARTYKAVQRIVIVDYDVHHGNGTQDAFYDDPDCLFISLHQEDNYPQNSGHVEETGGTKAPGTNINLSLPPGCGSGAYRYAFTQVVLPAIDRFQPDLILVSSGFDGSFQDPLARMMLSSEDYRFFAESLLAAAQRCPAQGRILFAHEGGYSKDYVPFCALAVIEALCGHNTAVVDPYLEEARSWGYQGLQPQQAAVIDLCASTHGLLPVSPSPEIANKPSLQVLLFQLQHTLDQVENEEDKVALLNSIITANR